MGRSREEWFRMADVSEELAANAQARALHNAPAGVTRTHARAAKGSLNNVTLGEYEVLSPNSNDTLSKDENGVPILPTTLRRIPAVRFGDLPEPTPREYVLEGLIPEGCCTTIYGDGGVAKSMLAMSLSISLALGKEIWMGRRITPQSVVYLDFELTADEQHRRAKALTAGTGNTGQVPDELVYISAVGYSIEEAFASAYSAMYEHSATMLVVDSFGLALTGEAESATDVIGFYRRYLQPFITDNHAVVLIDHQAKGGVYQRATSFGSVYKRNLVRSEIQIEALDQDEHKGTLDLVLRHTKHNFGAKERPIGAQVAFKDGEIQVNMAALNPRQLQQDDGTKPTERARIVLSYEDGPVTAKLIADECNMHFKMARAALEQLEAAGEVVNTGERLRGLPLYRRAAPQAREDALSRPERPPEGYDSQTEFSDDTGGLWPAGEGGDDDLDI